MKRVFMAAAIIAAFGVNVLQGAYANDLHLEQTNRATYAGLYASIPFGGPQNKSAFDTASVGFTAGFRHELRDSYGANAYRQVDARMLDMSFSRKGFDRFSFAGQPVLLNGTDGIEYVLGASEGEGGMSSQAAVILGVAAIAGLTAVLVTDNYAKGGCITVPTVSICSHD